jgi:hypothetical protein
MQLVERVLQNQPLCPFIRKVISGVVGYIEPTKNA